MAYIKYIQYIYKYIIYQQEVAVPSVMKMIERLQIFGGILLIKNIYIQQIGQIGHLKLPNKMNIYPFEVY